MIILDTTVLVYSVGVEHTFREPCRRLVAAIAGREIEATTTPEVIQEFCHVWSRRRPRCDAVERAGLFVDLLAPLLVVDQAVLGRGLQVFESTPALGGFDSILAGSALAAGAHALVSADRVFGTVPMLHHVMPDAAGVAQLIGAG